MRTYLTALQLPAAAFTVPFAPDCTRVENGVKTGFGATQLRWDLHLHLQYSVIREITDLVVTVEEHSVHAGLGGLVAEVLTGAGAAPRVVRIGIDDVWGESADNAYLLDLHGLSAERLVERIRSSVPAGARR